MFLVDERMGLRMSFLVGNKLHITTAVYLDVVIVRGRNGDVQEACIQVI